MKFEITVPYHEDIVTYSAFAFDDKAYWIRLLSSGSIEQPPKHIFLMKTENGWSSSCSEEAFVKELTSVIEYMYYGKYVH
jgi:hypothetical protein